MHFLFPQTCSKKHETGSHMPGLCETVKTTVRTTVVFTVYLIVSIGILMELEPDWSGIDAAYFTRQLLRRWAMETLRRRLTRRGWSLCS